MEIHLGRAGERRVSAGRGIVRELAAAIVVIFRFNDQRTGPGEGVELKRESRGLAPGTRHCDSPGVNRVVRETLIGDGEIRFGPGDVQAAADVGSI